MGDPKKPRKKYATPIHPWQKERIEEETELTKEYGLRNKKEIWKVRSLLKRYQSQAKRLTAQSGSGVETEKQDLLRKLQGYGILSDASTLGDVLNLTIKDLMERRLQTIVYRKSLARSVNQSRQFIVHRHITVDGKVITGPSYLVLKAEESSIGFIDRSSLKSEDHPERIELDKPTKVKEEKKPNENDKTTDK